MPTKTAARKAAKPAAAKTAARPARKAIKATSTGARPTMTLAELGTAIAALEGLPDIERARQAHRLFDVAQRLLPKIRQAAIYAATRERGSQARVAAELGVTPAAINLAITHHNKP